MSNLIIAILTVLVSFLNSILVKLTVVDVELELIDLEFEPVTSVNGQMDFFGVLDAPVEEVEVVETEEVITEVQVEFDYSSIVMALGLVNPVVETTEIVEEVVTPVEVVETVIVNNVVYTIHHKVGVDVRFSGRVHAAFTDVEGYLFEGTDGTSDFLLRVQAPLSMSNAKAWMSLNNETRAFDTKVVVTPTYKRI
jgi:hypothetical protein